MKSKDVILDFTSLLDIVLLILFFFILYSAFNVQESELRADEAKAAYEAQLDALEAEKAGLEQEQAQLQAEWERIEALDETAVKNQQALIAFNSGYMLSFNLQKADTSDDWTLSVFRKTRDNGEEERLGVIHPGDDLSGSIREILDRAGYREDDVLIITFTYDGSVIGTHRLYLDIMRAFRELQSQRKNVYLSAINISK